MSQRLEGALADFLRARLDEDEEAARDAERHTASYLAMADRKADRFEPPYSGADWRNDYDHVFVVDTRPGSHRKVRIADCGVGAFDLTPHLARHDPAHVLADVQAKRRIVDHAAVYWECDSGYAEMRSVLCELAAVYADHPDYQSEWRL